MTDNQLVAERKRKLGLWKEKGFGYAEKFERTHTSAQAKEMLEKKVPRDPELVIEKPKNKARMCGRLMNLREMGRLAFLRIRDRDGDFQICFTKQILGENFKPFLKMLDLGDFVGFCGEFFITKHGEPTLLAVEVFPLSKSLRPLPEKFHGVTDREICYRNRNIDLMTNPETFERFKIRSEMVREIRRYLEEKEFLEVETRVLQPQAGGAMAEVFRTHHNALDHEFVLRIALELDLKMIVSGGMERVFEIGKNFRNEGTDPSHLQEFTMLEWYAAYEDLDMNKKLTQEMIQVVLERVLGTAKVQVLDKDGKEHTVDFGKKFKSVSFAELLKKHAKIDMLTISDADLVKEAQKLGVDDAEKKGRAILLDDVYKKTARPTLIQPTFVLDYPEDLKPLARPKGDGTADCFQLLVAGWEIVNSYGELIDPQVQRELLERQAAAKEAGDAEAMEMNNEFVEAMEQGFPPMTGSGIGIDRLVALVTTQPNLRDVVYFPTMRPEQKKLSSKEAEALYRSKKVVVIADDQLDSGVVANAIGQLGISIGGHSKDSLFQAKILHDKEGQIHYTDCFYPMTNLAGDQQQMAEFVQKCYEAGVQVFDFTDIMRKAHTDAQMQKGYKEKTTKELGYMAVGALVPSDFEKTFLSGLKLFGS